jgi:4-hydroxybenzoate polyprenyltransferase
MNKKINNYLEFIQFKHTVFALPFALCSYILVSVKIGFQISDLVLILIALVSARIFGMSINRIFDVNIDKKNPRTINRGLISGSISFKGAYAIALISFLIFYLVIINFNINALYLSPIVIILFLIYPLTKRFTFLCHYFLGLVYLIAPPAVEIALTGRFSTETLFLGISGFFWVSGFDLIYAILDIDFDNENNIHSIPSKFGIKITKFLASISHLITLIFILSIGTIININPIYWFGCTIIIILFIREHIILKNITKENINTAFFDMNGQISIMFMATFLLSTII